MSTGTQASESTASNPTPPPPRTRRQWRTWALLLGILLLGAYFRTLSLYTWDEPSFRLHPDERFMIMVASDIRLPASATEYFDSAINPLNPRNVLNADGTVRHRMYVYGLLPQTLTRLTAVMLTPDEALPPYRDLPGRESDPQVINPEARFPKLTLLQPLLNPDGLNMTAYYEIHKIGRAWSVLFDLGSILLAFLIGRRLHGRRVGLLAALLLALAVLPIQLAHFFTVDAATAFFTLLTIYWAVRVAQNGGPLSFVALGMSIGGAMACRVTMATLGLVAILAVAQRVGLFGRDPKARFSPAAMRPYTALALLVLAGALSVLTFRVLQPDAFVGSAPGAPIREDIEYSALNPILEGRGFFDVRPDPRFISNIREIGLLISGELDAPPGQQWAGRTPYLFSWQNMVMWGMGLPLGLTAWGAWAVAGWLLFRRRALVHLLPWAWIAFYFLWQGGQLVMTMRYYGLLYGLLAIFAAWALVALWDERRRAREERRPARDDTPWWAVIGRRWTATLGPWALLFVVVGTFLWTYAFTRIYTEPHSRIQASRWIYENIPPGSTITSEEWDDPLPLGLDGFDRSRYTGIQMRPYAEDDLIKYIGFVDGNGNYVPGFLDQIDQADYIILSSNRVYDSATRLPMRYPALTRYYHYLFNGELGFRLAADITSYPRLFGVDIPDQSAEEAFSVYDHPRVLIFEKTENYSRERAEQLILGGVAWSEVYKLPVVQANKVPTALRLTETQWPAYRIAGTWSSLFDTNGMVRAAPWLFWLLALQLIGFATFALLFRLLPGLADRGYALSKILGLLLIAYLAWMLGSLRLLAFTPLSVWLLVGLLVLAAGVVGWSSRVALLAFVRARRRALLTAEGLFLLAFLGFVLIRALNPDLWHPARGGEKPMDLAYLTAVVKSPYFPPYDPWFAGGYINYYYFGFVLVAVLIQMTGIVPEIAYNLAVPTIFALTALGAWGIGYNLLAPRMRPLLSRGVSLRRRITEHRAIAAGVVAALFVVLLGNLAQASYFLPGSAVRDDPGMPAECVNRLTYAEQQICRGRGEWAFWDATRTVGAANQDSTISEFPFFTFLFADLHAHMLALPLALAALGLMVALVKVRASAALPRTWMQLLGPLLFILGALALVVGALRATNTWDYPTYLGLGILSLALVGWARWRRGVAWTVVLIGWAVAALLLVLLSNLLFWPFLSHFATEYAGFGLWTGARTPVAEFLKLHGLWLFLLISAALVLDYRARGIRSVQVTMMSVWVVLLLVVAGVLMADALVLAALLLLGTLGLFASLLLRSSPVGGDTPTNVPLPQAFVNEQLLHATRPSNRRTSLWASPLTLLPVLWVLAALGLVLLTELVVVNGDIGRMNTFFKFGMQTWVLFALASALSAVWIWRHLPRWRPELAWAWRGAAGVLVAAALLYPLTATPARLADRFDRNIGPTLDGTAYMQSAAWVENGQQFALRDDAAALNWMRQNIDGTPLVLEAHTDGYRWGARVSTYTGLPTLLGWPWHQTQQRTVARVEPILESRRALVSQLYGPLPERETVQLLRLYGIEYVYVGQLERALYSPADLSKFDSLVNQGQLQTVYASGETRIYYVPPSNHAPAVLTTALPVVPPTLPERNAAMLGQAATATAGQGDALMLGQPVDQLAVVDEYAWNPLARVQALAVLLWLLFSYVLAALGLPLAVLVFGRWRDGGYVWARLIGLLLLGYGVWMPVSARLWQYDRVGLLLGLLAVIALNVALLAWMGRRTQEAPEPGGDPAWSVIGGLHRLRAHLAAHRQPIFMVEGLFLGAFGFMLILRMFNPDLWQPIWGGEKPFEFGMLNAILRSPVMPPYDPFFSGGYLNYYYYGLFLVSLPIKAIGVAPAVGFNLIIPTLFALTLVGAFAIADQLTRRVRYGLIGAFFVAVAGNLATVLPTTWLGGGGMDPVWRALGGGLAGFGDRLDAWFVGPSRIIPFTINEFPYWSFLFADLHPHMIALPITTLMIALVYTVFDRQRLVLDEGRAGRQSWFVLRGRWALVLWALVALTLGALAVTNSWDFPTYALLLGGALLGAAWRAPTTQTDPAARRRELLRRLVIAAVGSLMLALVALLLYLPFFQSFQAQVGGIGLVTSGTEITDYLLLYGLFLAILIPALLGGAWRVLGARAREGRAAVPRPRTRVPNYRGVLRFRSSLFEPGALNLSASRAQLLLPVVALLVAIVAWTQPELGLKMLLATLILVTLPVLLARTVTATTWFVFWMAAVGLMVSLGVEFLFIRDHLAGGDWQRMNTVFKFGMQIWMLLALAAAIMLPLLLQGLRRFGVLLEGVVIALLALLGVVALVYPLVGTPSRLAYRFPESPGLTLDGLAFLDYAAYDWNGNWIELRHDAAAIRWLNENVAGTPVVLQSSMEFYRAYGVRVAANTGLPHVVSPLHANEQRDPGLVAARDAEVRTFFNTPDIDEALRILARYRVGYVYIGPIERAAYDPQGIAKFEQMTGAYLDMAFRNEGVTIYAVNPSVFSISPLEPVISVAQPVDQQAAIDALARQFAENPTDAGVAFGLAQRYYNIGDLDRAAEVLASAAAAHPGDIALHHLWGDVLRDAGRFAEAEQAYRHAAEREPNEGNYNKLGVELLAMGQPEAAEAALLRAIDINPDASDPYYHLGVAYEAQDLIDQAIAAYEQYLNLAPEDSPFRRLAIEALAMLE